MLPLPLFHLSTLQSRQNRELFHRRSGRQRNSGRRRIKRVPGGFRVFGQGGAHLLGLRENRGGSPLASRPRQFFGALLRWDAVPGRSSVQESSALRGFNERNVQLSAALVCSGAANFSITNTKCCRGGVPAGVCGEKSIFLASSTAALLFGSDGCNACASTRCPAGVTIPNTQTGGSVTAEGSAP